MTRVNMTDTSLGVISDFTNTPQAELKAKLIDHDTALDGQATDAAVAPANVGVFIEVTIPIAIPDAATTTYTYNVVDKMEIIDVTVIKNGAGAGNTIQVQSGAGVNISDAIAAAVDKTVTRAGTIDRANNLIAAAGSFKIVATRAAGSMAAEVYLTALRRP